MLAKISEGIPDAIKQLKGAPFLAEYKYDGTRAQIHLLSDNSVKVFSRNCEDKTASMPDVVAAIQAAAQGMLPSFLSHFVLWCHSFVQGGVFFGTQACSYVQLVIPAAQHAQRVSKALGSAVPMVTLTIDLDTIGTANPSASERRCAC